MFLVMTQDIVGFMVFAKRREKTAKGYPKDTSPDIAGKRNNY